MPLRLDDLVVCGELFNTQWYSVHGWLQLKGHESPMLLQLTGNCSPDLAGWHIRFRAHDADGDGEPSADAGAERRVKQLKLAWQQIGPTGDMTAFGQAPSRNGDSAAAATESSTGSDTAAWSSQEKSLRGLHLEWQSQNGQVVLDMPDAVLEFVDFSEIRWGVSNRSRPLPWSQPGEDELELAPEPMADEDPSLDLEDDDHGDDSDLFLAELESEEADDADDADVPWNDDDDEPDDPYGLFPENLEEQLEPPLPPPWEKAGDEDASEVIREMELMDDLIENSPGEPVGEIFDRPMRLPLPDDVDDAQAELALKSLLAEMALYGIALDICQHYTPRDAYRLLVEEICREQRAYPELRQTQWVQQFMTSEFCEACDAEFDREWDERQRRSGESGEEPDNESDLDDDVPF